MHRRFDGAHGRPRHPGRLRRFLDCGLRRAHGGHDALAGSGGFTAAGSASLTEGHDALAGSGMFAGGGAMAVMEGHDALAATGYSDPPGNMAVTEAHDALAGSGTFATSASLGITEGHDTTAGFSSDLVYHIYSNTGVGDPIDYSTILATTGLLTWTSSPLAYPGTWRFGVRAFNPVNGLEEENLDCSIALILELRRHRHHEPAQAAHGAAGLPDGRGRHPGRVGVQHDQPAAGPDRLPRLRRHRRDTELHGPAAQRSASGRRSAARSSPTWSASITAQPTPSACGPLTARPKNPTPTPSTSPPTRSAPRP